MKYNFPMLIPVVILKIISIIDKFIDLVRSWHISVVWGVRLGVGTSFHGKTIVRTRHKGSICVGEYSVFNSKGIDNLVGLMTPTILDVRHGGQIIIGNRSGFSSVVMSSMAKIEVGNNVNVGGNVRIFDHDFHSLEPEYRRTNDDRLHIRSRAIKIEDDVFIGTNAIILKGTTIGARSIVAAGSIVFGLQIPPDSLVKGNPAVIVKSVAN